MGVDQNEARRRRKVDASGYSKTEPIAAIQKRAIHSPAFAKLPPTSVVVLLLLACNLEKGKNGHIFVSADDAQAHGIDSKTLYRSLKSLMTTGFIFQTSRGGHGRCSTYALTWLPLSKDTSGLYVEGFRMAAWREHDKELAEWKKSRGKMSTSTGQISRQPPKPALSQAPSCWAFMSPASRGQGDLMPNGKALGILMA